MPDESLLAVQRDFLTKVVRKEASYSLRIAKARPRHVLMYGSNTQAFCGVEFRTRPQIIHMAYEKGTLESICPGCRTGIAGLVAEVAS